MFQIKDKIKNGEKLTEKELKFLFRDVDSFVDEIEIDSDSFTDSYMIVFDIGNEEYYSITVHSWEYV